MNKFKSVLYHFIYPTALIYTVFSAAFYILSRLTSTDEGTKSYATLMLLLLLYAFVLALISQVFRTKRSAVIKVIIHYTLVLASLIVVFLIAKDAFSFSSAVIIISVFTAVYAAVAIPCLIVYFKKKKAAEEKEEYKSRYSKK